MCVARPDGRALARLLQRQPHAVIGRDDGRRRTETKHLVIQIGVHVDNDSPARIAAAPVLAGAAFPFQKNPSALLE